MGFAMRQKTNEEIIKLNSFRSTYIDGKKSGFEFDVQLSYYRGHYLSAIEELEVLVDGEKMPDETVTFEINGKEMSVYRIKRAVTEYWNQASPAKIRVLKRGGIAAGKHELELRLMLRIPYMQIGPEHDYMPLDSGQKVEITLKD